MDLPVEIQWILIGMVGALAHYLFSQLPNPESEWSIVLPSIREGKLYLGVLMYLILGGTAGWFAPAVIGNGVNSFLAGYTFSAVFDSLAQRKVSV